MEKTLFKEEKYFLRIFLFIKRKKRVQYLWIDTWVDSESLWVALLWQFEFLLWNICSWYSLANHFDLPGSQSIYGISQNPPMCAHPFLSQDGFYQRGLWVKHPLTSLPFDLRGAFLHVCVIGNISSLQESEICGLSKIQPPLLFPVILILEFRCTGD